MFALSWKHKFLLLIIVTLIGLALMTASAMVGLQQLGSSYREIVNATAYETTAQRLLTHWLRIEALSAGLSEDNHIQLLNSLNTLPATADQMNIQAGDLKDSNVSDAAKTIADNMKQYVELRQQWLKNRRKLGWDTDMNGPFSDEQKPLVAEIRKQAARLDLIGEGVASDIELLTSQLSNDIITARTTQAEKVDKIAKLVTLATSAVVALILLVTLIRISLRLNKRLSAVRQLLTRVAGGDLTASVELTRNRRDEFNQLGESANQMVEEMAGLIRRLVNGNRELSTLQQHLDDTMHQLGDNSEQVEQQTEQAASATQEISMTVGEVAKRTAEVSRGSVAASEAAHSGAEIIASSVDSMKRLAELIQGTHEQVGRLAESGHRVTSIIDMINGLADQTNLLALNAAIEAARAGDAGRGFSVVADEVRSLAQKTVDATTGISSIIAEFSDQTRQMSQLMESSLQLAEESEHSAENLAHTIDNITQTISTLSVDMEQVVVAVEQISATSEDIAGKMEQINEHTGATKSLRLSLDNHSQRLADQTQELISASGRFQIGA